MLGMAATPSAAVRQASALSMRKASHLGLRAEPVQSEAFLCTLASGAFGPRSSCEQLSPHAEGNSQFSQPTIRPTALHMAYRARGNTLSQTSQTLASEYRPALRPKR
jgi:hypothetical protein